VGVFSHIFESVCVIVCVYLSVCACVYVSGILASRCGSLEVVRMYVFSLGTFWECFLTSKTLCERLQVDSESVYTFHGRFY
jgi:hypothetical protein